MTKQINSTPKEPIISDKIHFIRNQRVMLDRYLAELYGVETKRLKEQVRRNIERFPESFMFELTEEEAESSRSQIATLKRGDNIKYLPYAFTEHGILMLANVLKSKQAVQMSIKIIEVFVKMREALIAHKEILLQLEKLQNTSSKHSAEIKYIFDVLKKLIEKPKEERVMIGYRK
ncbi:MAG: ORF6N domain-containing protein [Flavobacteriales bacterium]